jgi:hypothetical protein
VVTNARRIAAGVVLASGVALAPGIASAAGGTGNGATNGQGAGSPTVPAPRALFPRVGGPVSSLALVPTSTTSVDIAGGVNTGPASSDTTVSGLPPGTPSGSAVTPDGAVGLVAESNGTLQTVLAPATAPAVGTTINVSQFIDEGAVGFGVFTSGVALTPDGTAGLATADSQGAIALVRQGNTFAVDTRVQSPGVNSAGSAHLPGWVSAPADGTPVFGHNLYDGVTVSQSPGADGQPVGLLIDRSNHTVVVVTGVGTAGVKSTGSITDASLTNLVGSLGNGVTSFSPTTALHAVVGTATGFSVLNLANPAAPTLGSATPVAGGGTSVAVAPDGDHVAVASGATLSFFSGLSTVGAGSPLTPSAAPLVLPGVITDLGVTRGGNLAVVYHGAVTGMLAVVAGMTTATPARLGVGDLSLSGFETSNNAATTWLPVGSPPGYWLTGGDGGIFAFNAPFFGSTGGMTLAQPVVALSAARDGRGYYFVARDGGVFAYGSASFQGSVPGAGAHVTNVVGVAQDTATGGYWLVGSDGGVFGFNAPYLGSLPGLGIHVNNIVGMAATPDGGGYWLVGSDGGIFAFGDAVFAGSMGGRHLNKPVVGIAVDPSTGGYWEVATDGGVFAFGAPFFGSTGNLVLNQPVVGLAATPDGQGYWFAAADGGMFSFGDAVFEGSLPSLHITPNMPIVGIASLP